MFHSLSPFLPVLSLVLWYQLFALLHLWKIHIAQLIIFGHSYFSRAKNVTGIYTFATNLWKLKLCGILFFIVGGYICLVNAISKIKMVALDRLAYLTGSYDVGSTARILLKYYSQLQALRIDTSVFLR